MRSFPMEYVLIRELDHFLGEGVHDTPDGKEYLQELGVH